MPVATTSLGKASSGSGNSGLPGDHNSVLPACSSKNSGFVVTRSGSAWLGIEFAHELGEEPDTFPKGPVDVGLDGVLVVDVDDADHRMALAKTVDAADALLDPHGIPGHVVVHDSISRGVIYVGPSPIPLPRTPMISLATNTWLRRRPVASERMPNSTNRLTLCEAAAGVISNSRAV